MQLLSDTDIHILKGRSIVIADDDDSLLQTMKVYLANFVTVFLAHNGVEALELTKEHLPDIVISEQMTSKLNTHKAI